MIIFSLPEYYYILYNYLGSALDEEEYDECILYIIDSGLNESYGIIDDSTENLVYMYIDEVAAHMSELISRRYPENKMNETYFDIINMLSSLIMAIISSLIYSDTNLVSYLDIKDGFIFIT